ncbi:hypothetical protein SHIRM173S_09435 [Streptomyces hirsutus]
MVSGFRGSWACPGVRGPYCPRTPGHDYFASEPPSDFFACSSVFALSAASVPASAGSASTVSADAPAVSAVSAASAASAVSFLPKSTGASSEAAADHRSR